MFKPWGQWGGHTVIGVDSMPGTHTSSIGLAIRCAMDALIGMLIMAAIRLGRLTRVQLYPATKFPNVKFAAARPTTWLAQSAR